jgi:hypothetical protein
MNEFARKRWHSDKKILAHREQLKALAKNTILAALADDLPSKTLKNAMSFHVVRDCDLRATLEEKAISCHKLAGWTAFVNRKGNLVHVLPQEGDFHIRLPIYYSIANATDKHIVRILQGMVHGRLA